jgi:hypothetical protein
MTIKKEKHRNGKKFGIIFSKKLKKDEEKPEFVEEVFISERLC